MRKLTIIFTIASIFLLIVILSGCFNTQSMISYEFYSQSTPASVLHVYVKVKSITADNVVTTYDVNKKVDLVENDVENIISNIGVGQAPVSIPYLRFSFDPVATVVYTDSTTTFNIATTTVRFYGYATQQMQESPLKITGMGQNKIAFVLWNLSEFSTPSTQLLTLEGKAFDKDNLLKVEVRYRADLNGPYFAGISDSINSMTSSFKFIKKCGEDNYDQLNGEYKFTLYTFKAPVSTYRANITISTATQTVLSTDVTIGSTDISITLP